MNKSQIKQAAYISTLQAFGLHKTAALSSAQIAGLLGAGLGGVGGYMSAPEAETPERVLRGLGGAGLGGAVGYYAMRGFSPSSGGVDRKKVDENIATLEAARDTVNRQSAERIAKLESDAGHARAAIARERAAAAQFKQEAAEKLKREAAVRLKEEQALRSARVAEIAKEKAEAIKKVNEAAVRARTERVDTAMKKQWASQADKIKAMFALANKIHPPNPVQDALTRDALLRGSGI
jgi:hypothetical protein